MLLGLSELNLVANPVVALDDDGIVGHVVEGLVNVVIERLNSGAEGKGDEEEDEA